MRPEDLHDRRDTASADRVHRRTRFPTRSLYGQLEPDLLI